MFRDRGPRSRAVQFGFERLGLILESFCIVSGVRIRVQASAGVITAMPA